MHTTSLAWPNMFAVSRNCVNVYEDNQSIVNRTKLMMLTDKAELYNSPNFGLGLKKYLFTYSSDNTKAKIKEELITQLRLHDPSTIPEKTQMSDGLLYTGSDKGYVLHSDKQKLELTFAIQTTFGDTLNINTGDVQADVDNMNSSL